VARDGPALAFGAVNVVGSLRLDELGAGTAIIGGTFLAMAALEAIVSPLVGRVSDRRGRLVPIRAGLAAATAALLLVTLPQAVPRSSPGDRARRVPRRLLGAGHGDAGRRGRARRRRAGATPSRS
jgi:MFS family permease